MTGLRMGSGLRVASFRVALSRRMRRTNAVGGKLCVDVGVERARNEGAHQPAAGIGHEVEADRLRNLVALRVPHHQVAVDGRVDGKEQREEADDHYQAHQHRRHLVVLPTRARARARARQIRE